MTVTHPARRRWFVVLLSTLMVLGLLASPPASADDDAGDGDDDVFTLQVLHASDLEGGVEALDRAANFAAIVDALEDRDGIDASITLSAGDNYIPGPFFSAAGDRAVFRDGGVFNDVYNDLLGTTAYDALREGGGRVDISIMNVIGFAASAIGNHEFDGGSDVFESIILEDARDPDGPGGDRWVGARFPYLSANLDFSGDGTLAPLSTNEILPNTDFLAGETRLAPATTVEAGGERIGVIGATTQVLESISSPSGTEVVGPKTDDMPALAGILQPVVDRLEADGVDKIVLVSHLQQLALEEALAPLLDGVDVIVAGGSDTLLANSDDALRAGDAAEREYPVITRDAAGDPTVIVSTGGEYSYVGQLSVSFDEDGLLVGRYGTRSATRELPEDPRPRVQRVRELIQRALLRALERAEYRPLRFQSQLDLTQNGPVRTEAEDVAEAWDGGNAFAEGTKGELVERLVEAARGVVLAKDGNFVGDTSVFIEGRREFVRTEETNLGNLTADANLAYAQAYDPTVVISLKNGGGIRAEIGEIVNTGGTTDFLPPQDNPLIPGDDTGLISQLDVENSLRFNNGLSLLTLTAAQLVEVVEHAVSQSGPGSTPGRFAQVAGITYTYSVAEPAGSRVIDLTVDLQGGPDVVVSGGELQGDPARTYRVVTLDFLAGGGDDYPYDTFDPGALARVDLAGTAAGPDASTFAAPGTEQDALAEYLLANFAPDGAAPFFDEAEVPGGSRITEIS